MGLFGLRCMHFRQTRGWVGERGVACAEATAERTCRNAGGICPQGRLPIWLFRRAMPPGGTVLYLYAAEDEDG